MCKNQRAIADKEPVQVLVATADVNAGTSLSTAQSMGLVVSDLTEAQKKELKVRGGVRIETAGEAPARAGLQQGDVILAIANTEIAQVKDFENAMNKLDKSKPFTVLFRRGDVAQFALIRPAK